uniref:Uncharacterized protein n=1 Tax=Glossina austeni TaxID=7395 RepID=A0A1A9V082_GLOAU
MPTDLGEPVQKAAVFHDKAKDNLERSKTQLLEFVYDLEAIPTNSREEVHQEAQQGFQRRAQATNIEWENIIVPQESCCAQSGLHQHNYRNEQVLYCWICGRCGLTAELAKRGENPTPTSTLKMMSIGVGPGFVGTPMEIAVAQQAADQKQQSYTFTYEEFRLL